MKVEVSKDCLERDVYKIMIKVAHCTVKVAHCLTIHGTSVKIRV